MEANEVFTNNIDGRKRDIEYAKQRLTDLRKARKVLMPIIKHLAPLLGKNDHISLSADASWYHGIYITMDKLDGFKDVRLEQMLFVVMALKNVVAEDTQDQAEWLSRTYNFMVKADTTDIRIRVEANVKSDSQTCRKVKVGEKLEVVAEYAIQCD